MEKKKELPNLSQYRGIPVYDLPVPEDILPPGQRPPEPKPEPKIVIPEEDSETIPPESLEEDSEE